MSDKQTILIAGATGNIGGGAALALARHGANVVLLGRKLETLEARADSIRATLSEAQIEFQDTEIATLAVDFADMDSVRQAAAEALNRFPAIHGLIHSAVTLIQNGPNILPNGHELMFAVNVMGPFLFTQLLLERMQQSDGLVLHVIAPFHQDIDWLAAAGVTRGCNPPVNDRFCPDDYVSRGQIAAFLVRALGYSGSVYYAHVKLHEMSR